MALTKVAVDYIKEHRAVSSDASIRAALAGQGFSDDLLDQAFAQAGSRPMTAPPAPAAAPIAPKRRLWPWVLGAAAGASLMGLAGLVALGMWGGARGGKAKLSPELANYHPVPLSSPVHLPRFLPEGLLDEDAAQDYMAIIATKGGMMEGAPGRETPLPTAEQVALMDSALKKRRSTFGLLLVRPGSDALLVATTVKISVLLSLSRHIQERFKNARERGDWAQAEIESRRHVLLGWHSAQDWDLAIQMLGLTTMVGGILENSVAAEKLGRRDAEYIFSAQRAPLDLLAYGPGKEVLAAIEADAADLAKLPRLAENITDPSRRRAYASWTLMNVATNWSAEEKLAARPAPSRATFFIEAAALGDPAVERIAKAFEVVMKEAEAELSGVPAEKRSEVLDEINKRMAAKGPSNF